MGLCLILFLLILVVFVFLNIGIALIICFYFRKCPYCGKRMTYEYKKRDKLGEVESYEFNCHHCGAWESISPEEMCKETAK